MKVEIVHVTPDLAERWLGFNTWNRNKKHRRIDVLVDAMLRGEWHLSPDAIAFRGFLTGRGKNAPILLNGQHRLEAVVESDTEQDFIVVEGLDLEHQLDMDTGSRRSFGDQLKLRGETDVANLAAVTRLAFLGSQGPSYLRGNNIQPTYAQLTAYFDRNAESLREAVGAAWPIYRQLGGRFVVYSYTHHLLAGLKGETVNEDLAHFFKTLETGENLELGNPIYVIRQQLIAMNARTTATRAKPPPAHQIALLIKAWNAYRDGAYVSNITWRSGGLKPEPFPEPR